MTGPFYKEVPDLIWCGRCRMVLDLRTLRAAWHMIRHPGSLTSNPDVLALIARVSGDNLRDFVRAYDYRRPR